MTFEGVETAQKNDLIRLGRSMDLGRWFRMLTFCQQREPQGWERRLRLEGLKITRVGNFLAMCSAVQRD